MAPAAFFRANVGACVTDGRGRVLACRRRGLAEAAWQMPQGGLDVGETPRTAVLRELREETGLAAADVGIVDEYPEWLAYELPPQYRRPKVGLGQVQKWFLLRAQPGVAVRLDQREFDACEWLTPRVLLARVVAFRQPVYARLFERWPRLRRSTATATSAAAASPRPVRGAVVRA
jgi:putative (di)nucleoside polyphosphate hydrolase